MTKARELAKLGEVMTNSQIGGRRNIIVNPKMEIAQRGTSASSKTSSDYFTCDRWRTEASGATYNTSQQTNSASDMATTGAEHFLRMEVTTGNNNSGISQKIEAQNIKQFKGKKLTLSFYAKGTNPNGGSFDVRRQFSDGVNTSGTRENSSLTVTSSWVKYTYTFDYPDEGSVDFTLNTAKMALSFVQPDGDTSTNAWTLDLTSVQLEVGSQATPLEHLSFGEQLALCQRYYVLLSNGVGQTITNGSAYNANQVSGVVTFPVDMRGSPSVDQTSGTNYYSYISNATNFVFDGFSGISGSSLRNTVIYKSGLSGLTSASAGWLQNFNSSSYVALDSEL